MPISGCWLLAKFLIYGIDAGIYIIKMWQQPSLRSVYTNSNIPRFSKLFCFQVPISHDAKIVMLLLSCVIVQIYAYIKYSEFPIIK